MADCYFCGVAIARGSGFRRMVVTGYSQRIYITRTSGGSVGRSTGLRTLCASCASSLDHSRQGLGFRMSFSVVAGLLGSATALSMMKNAQGGFSVLVFFFFLLGGAGVLTYWLLDALHKTSDPSSAPAPVSKEGSPAVESHLPPGTAIEDPFSVSSAEEAVDNLITRCSELGFSLLDCYEVEDSRSGRASVLARLQAIQPLQARGDLDTWSIAILTVALSKIQHMARSTLQQCATARIVGDDSEVSRLLTRLVKVIPRKPGETEGDYLLRANEVVAEAGSLQEAGERYLEISARTAVS